MRKEWARLVYGVWICTLMYDREVTWRVCVCVCVHVVASEHNLYANSCESCLKLATNFQHKFSSVVSVYSSARLAGDFIDVYSGQLKSCRGIWWKHLVMNEPRDLGVWLPMGVTVVSSVWEFIGQNNETIFVANCTNSAKQNRLLTCRVKLGALRLIPDNFIILRWNYIY